MLVNRDSHSKGGGSDAQPIPGAGGSSRAALTFDSG